jgi:hypothetical protein
MEKQGFDGIIFSQAAATQPRVNADGCSDQ